MARTPLDVCDPQHFLFHFCLLSLDLKRTGFANGSIRLRQPLSRRTSQPSLGNEVTMTGTVFLSTQGSCPEMAKPPRRGVSTSRMDSRFHGEAPPQKRPSHGKKVLGGITDEGQGQRLDSRIRRNDTSECNTLGTEAPLRSTPRIGLTCSGALKNTSHLGQKGSGSSI